MTCIEQQASAPINARSSLVGEVESAVIARSTGDEAIQTLCKERLDRFATARDDGSLASSLNYQMRLPYPLAGEGASRASAYSIVMRGLDPRIHPLFEESSLARWIAGHRQAEATPFFERLCPAMTSSKSDGSA